MHKHKLIKMLSNVYRFIFSPMHKHNMMDLINFLRQVWTRKYRKCLFFILFYVYNLSNFYFMFINHCNLLNMFSIAGIAERGKHPNHCRKDIWWFGFEQSQECSSGGLILLCLPSILPLLLTSKHCYFDGSWNMKYVIIVSIFLVMHSQHTNHHSFSSRMVSKFCELIFLIYFYL